MIFPLLATTGAARSPQARRVPFEFVLKKCVVFSYCQTVATVKQRVWRSNTFFTTVLNTVVKQLFNTCFTTVLNRREKQTTRESLRVVIQLEVNNLRFLVLLTHCTPSNEFPRGWFLAITRDYGHLQVPGWVEILPTGLLDVPEPCRTLGKA